ADSVEPLLLVPHVVAGRHHVRAPVDQLIADLARDAKAGRGVFGVRDHQIDPMVLDEPGEALTNQLASGTADDISDEQDAHQTDHEPQRRQKTTLDVDERCVAGASSADLPPSPRLRRTAVAPPHGAQSAPWGPRASAEAGQVC